MNTEFKAPRFLNPIPPLRFEARYALRFAQ